MSGGDLQQVLVGLAPWICIGVVVLVILALANGRK
jgi:hypothetical protein